MTTNFRRSLCELKDGTGGLLERRASEIWWKYGGDVSVFLKESSSYEKEVVDRWLDEAVRSEELFDDVKKSLHAYGWILARVIWQHSIYPIILRPDVRDEDQDVVSAFDLEYLKHCWPTLWGDFLEEMRASPDYETDREAALRWRISNELQSAFKLAREDRDRMKDEVRKELREIEEEDETLLAEESGENPHKSV